MSGIVIYADIMFLINFSMDVLSLAFTARVLHKPMRAKKICAAAALGGAAATASEIFIPRSSFLGGIIFTLAGIALSVIMTRISFGRYHTGTELIRHSIVLWGSGALLGGVMTYILSLGEPVFGSSGAEMPFAAVLFLCMPITYAVVRMTTSMKQRKTVVCTLKINGEAVSFNALCDSGNLAAEPISSLPVAVVSHTVISDMLNDGDETVKWRAVPIKTIGGERLLFGFIPDELTIDARAVSAVVAIDKENKSFGGCAAIVPASLCSERFIKREEKENGTKKSENRSI